MEFVAASIGIAEATARASSKLWKLSRQWQNAPRDIYELRDEVDHASRLYALAQSVINPASTATSPFGVSRTDSQQLAAQNLDSLLAKGQNIVGKIQDILDLLLAAPSEAVAGPAQQVIESASQTRAEVLSKRRRLIWLRNSRTVKHLKKAISQNVEQLGVHLVLLNVILTTNIPGAVPLGEKLPEGDTLSNQTPNMIPTSVTGDDDSLLEAEEATISDFHVSRSPTLVDFSVSEPGPRVDIADRVGEDDLEMHVERAPRLHLGPTDAQLMHKLEQLMMKLDTGKSPNEKPHNNSSDGPWSMFIEKTAQKEQIARICDQFCRCSCHSTTSPYRWAMTSLDKMFGAFRLSFTGNPVFGTSHSDPTCINRNRPSKVRLHYKFPDWLAATAVCFDYSGFANQGPELLLRVIRRIPRQTLAWGGVQEDFNVFDCINEDDLDGLKDLLVSRRGSVLDTWPRMGGVCPIHYAITKLRVDMVKFLLHAGADLHQADDSGTTPISSAFALFAFGNSVAQEFVKFLPLEDFLDDEGFTDLHRVVIGLLPISLEETLQLPRFRAQINAKTTPTGYTPLHMARSGEVVRALCRAGADVNCQDSRGKTPLMWACYLGNVGVVEALLESGADVSLQENNGNHALTAGVVCTSADLAHAFQVMDLVLGQNPDHRMLEDAFSNSVIYGRIEIFRFLLGIVGDVNYANRSSGRLTPLLQAIARGTAYRVGALLCHGADYTLKDVCGQNILLYLGKFGNWPMIQLFQCLELSGLDPNAISVDKETAQDLIDKRTDVTDKFKKEYRKLLDDCESRKGETPATFELSKTTLSKIMDIMDRYPDNLVAWNSAPAKK